MLEPLREDFIKLRVFLDRQSKPVTPAEATATPGAPILLIVPPQPAQMELVS